MLQYFLQIDEQLTLMLNGSSSLFLDRLAVIATSTWTWMPVAFILLYVVLKNNSRRNAITVLLFVGLCILLADQMASGICKPYFERLRPARDLDLLHRIDIVGEYRGGMYGFFSSHAANTFAVATFVALLVRSRGLTLSLYSWALLNCWTRLYLGVHYFGDILVGVLWGLLVGISLYFVWHRWVCDNIASSSTARTGMITSGGYQVNDVMWLTFSILLTYVIIIIISFLPLF
jgi:undecaprenyl-diphosphatase